jgi:hypothetical protein
VLGVLVAAACAGCGGGDDADTYALADSADCFRERGGRVVSTADAADSTADDRATRAALRVAAKDADGALSVPAAGGRATIVFARDEEAADVVAARNRRVLRDGGVLPETAQRLVERRGNAVVLWPDPPTVEDVDALADCLIAD